MVAASGREPLELIVVEALVLLADAVGHDPVELAREVQRVAVGEVPAVCEVHAEQRVARLERGEEHVGFGTLRRSRSLLRIRAELMIQPSAMTA